MLPKQTSPLTLRVVDGKTVVLLESEPLSVVSDLARCAELLRVPSVPPASHEAGAVLWSLALSGRAALTAVVRAVHVVWRDTRAHTVRAVTSSNDRTVLRNVYPAARCVVSESEILTADTAERVIATKVEAPSTLLHPKTTIVRILSRLRPEAVSHLLVEEVCVALCKLHVAYVDDGIDRPPEDDGVEVRPRAGCDGVKPHLVLRLEGLVGLLAEKLV